MKIDHIALYTTDIEKLKAFYERYFNARAGEKYTNPKKQFQSYFLSFSEGSRIEIMQKSGIPARAQEEESMGLTHFAIAVGDKEKVDLLTEQLRTDGYAIVGEPRTTGDGYYESVALDPDGNRIEITI
ncbi:lactoylglutathione lyase [Chryseolinea serpens]|uniref:Lactoylglutathione lyase n=1 Tax=Chryseolinea serpens TaxID=947013 RepID=A0A1M5WL65_9BACT|nr:VOC family protein [Chryseolinea serpens]SHH88286.1 lactoylglutathione lyase [Chryseolinea serpens]